MVGRGEEGRFKETSSGRGGCLFDVGYVLFGCLWILSKCDL